LLKSEPLAERALARRVLNAAYRLGGDDRARDLYRFAQRGDADERLRVEALSLLARWAAPPPYDLVVGGLSHLPNRSGNALGELKDDFSSQLLSAEMDKLARGLVPAELSLDLRLALETRGLELSPRLREEAGARRTAMSSLAKYLDSLFGGDARIGRALFR